MRNPLISDVNDPRWDRTVNAGMSEQQLTELEALANAATKGPWDSNEIDKESAEVGSEPERRALGYLHWPDHAANAKFIAAAREAVPNLVAELRLLRKLSGIGPVKFTHEDVSALRSMHDGIEAAPGARGGPFAQRIQSLADRIAALLPPRD